MIITHISNEVIMALNEERALQRKKFGKEPFASAGDFIRIAGEEFGEVCRAVNQGADTPTIYTEIKQLAAVCIAFLDGDLHDGRAK